MLLPCATNMTFLPSTNKGKIVSVREMRQKPSEMLSTLELIIELPPGVQYRTAQNILLFPQNTEATVNRILEYLDCQGDLADKLVVLSSSLSKEERSEVVLGFPLNISLRTIARNHLDIKGTPK